jgi:hypothetical protein
MGTVTVIMVSYNATVVMALLGRGVKISPKNQPP